MKTYRVDYTALSDEDLLKLIKKNDNTAFKLLFKKYYPRLYGYANRYIQEQTIVEDIIQEVFLNFWERRNILKSISIGSLLFCMVRNACINYLKQKSLVENYSIDYLENLKGEEKLYSLDFSLSADEKILYQELQKQINDVLSHLSVRTREIFLLSRFEKLKNKEIAEKLGISQTAVEKHLSKSLKTISEYLKKNSDYTIYIIILSFILENS